MTQVVTSFQNEIYIAVTPGKIFATGVNDTDGAIGRHKWQQFQISYTLKGPKHDQVGYEFFYIKQTRMVRWLGDWQKK